MKKEFKQCKVYSKYLVKLLKMQYTNRTHTFLYTQIEYTLFLIKQSPVFIFYYKGYSWEEIDKSWIECGYDVQKLKR